MKIVTPLFLSVVAILFLSQSLISQTRNDALDNSTTNAQQQCLSNDDVQSLKNLISENIALLKQQGTNFASSRSRVRFSWPLRQAAGFNDPSYYYIGNYVDVNRTNGVRDYNCGTHTYDGHNGTDIALWPFPQYKQDNNAVEVIAAAAGTILTKYDGAYDRNCNFGSSETANSITIRHQDGSISIYLHLKKWSLTNKAIGSYVQAGEYLGVVGSSGRSTAPHLHFEVWADQYRNNIIDPYSGSCNNFNSSTWWTSQKSYKETKINSILTHNAPPNHNYDCAFNGERRNVSNQFQAGNRVYFSLNLAHENGGTKYFKIYQPNGVLWNSWNIQGIVHSNSYWFYDRILPSNAMSGNWRYVVSYKGQQAEHFFSVGNSSGGNSSTCTSVPTLQCGQTINSSTYNEQNNFGITDYSDCYSNSSSFNARDKTYKIVVSNTSKLTVNLTRLSKDLDLFLFEGCPSNRNCLEYSIRGSLSSEQIVLNNARGTYYIVIDGYNSQEVSSFTLSATCGGSSSPTPTPLPTPTPTCSAASISCGQTAIGSTFSASNNYIGSDYGNCLPGDYAFSARDKLYKLNVTNRRNLRIRLTNLSKDLDIFLLSNCTPMTCIASSIKSGTSSEEIILNNALGTYFISVDGYQTDQVSSFNLHVDCLSSWNEEDIQVSKIASTSVNKTKKQFLDFTIYPNPTSDLITIDLESSVSGNAEIEIYNLNGNLIRNNTQFLEIGLNYFTENLSNLSDGLYYIRISNGLETKVKKIQKIKH